MVAVRMGGWRKWRALDVGAGICDDLAPTGALCGVRGAGKAAECSSCQELGHRADVCPNRRTFFRCPHCSKKLSPEQEASEQSHE
ncbi:hypothetical protein MTO96_033506, partial [Rhipicephalus appendiculatus]